MRWRQVRATLPLRLSLSLSQPSLVDWDNDDDLDLVVLCGGNETMRKILYFDNIGGKLEELHHELNPFHQVVLDEVLYVSWYQDKYSYFGCLYPADVDDDGDYDLLVSKYNVKFVQVLEQLADGSLKRLTGDSEMFSFAGERTIRRAACAAYGDLDLDGVGDFVIGDSKGKLTLQRRKVFKQEFSELSARPDEDRFCRAIPQTPSFSNFVG